MKAYITKLHIVLEIVAVVVSIVSFAIMLVWAMNAGPEVATHFDFYGNPDGYGSPYNYLILPIVFLGINIMMDLMTNFLPASAWNIPFKINEGRELVVYRDFSLMVVVISLEFSLMSLGLSLVEIMVKNAFVGPVVLVPVAVIILTTIIFSIIAVKHNKM